MRAHTSKVWPQSDIITLQEFIHRLLHERHVARFIDAEKKKKKHQRRGGEREGGRGEITFGIRL